MLAQISAQWRLVQSTAKDLKIYEIQDPKVDEGLHEFCASFGQICEAF